MLIKQTRLKQIRDGQISLLFRRWTKPRVNKGSLIRTSVGLVEILDIIDVKPWKLTLSDANNAGYAELTDLHKSLDSPAEGIIYKVQVSYHSPDPRLDLRDQVDLSQEEFAQLISKLHGFDKRSSQGTWVQQVLIIIRKHPRLRAIELAEKLGKPKDWLKINIRKLKNLGLTISLDTGYILSPRGEKVLNRIRSEQI